MTIGYLDPQGFFSLALTVKVENMECGTNRGYAAFPFPTDVAKFWLPGIGTVYLDCEAV